MQSLTKDILTYLLQFVGLTGGGALVVGRILLVTAARKHGYVRAPAIVVKSPSVDTTNNGMYMKNKNVSKSSPRSTSVVCIVLLPTNYVPKDVKDRRDVHNSNIEPMQLGYIGIEKNRYYAIHRIEFDEILLVTSIKYKIDINYLYEDNVLLSKTDCHGCNNNSFARVNSIEVNRKGNTTVDDIFAGTVTTGKNGASLNKVRDLFGTSRMLNKVIFYLIEANQLESHSALEAIDLKECIKGLHHGNGSMIFNSKIAQWENLMKMIRNFQSHYSPSLESHFAIVERRETLRSTVNTLQHLLSNESLQLFPDYLQRKSLLRTLNYIDHNDLVCVKGRVACEVNTCEELIVTELVFEGTLNEMEPAEIVAVLSALVFQEKTSNNELDSELPEKILTACNQMKIIATNLGNMQQEHGIQIVPCDYCDNSLKFGLVRVVYDWAMGVPFSSICELTLVQEGSIVRCITRLDELCREVRNCARVIGNPILYRKMEYASVSIKRDIVFATSLYVN